MRRAGRAAAASPLLLLRGARGKRRRAAQEQDLTDRAKYLVSKDAIQPKVETIIKKHKG